ncbi:D-glycero-beta-D-manno-heptose 1-phosphate adenylyltransferase, partial [Streptomyces sp. NPDC005917]
PVVWDPHPRGGPPVPGVRLATPSASEARSFAATASGGTAPQGAAQEGAESRRVAQARAFGGATAPQHAVREGAGGRPTRPSVADARAFAGAEHGGSTASQDAAQDGAGGRPVADAGAFADAEPGSSTASQGAAQEGTAGRPTGPSDAEARALGGAGSRGSAAFQWAARDAAALVRAWRAASVVVTLGGRGALLSHGETPLLLPSPVTAEGDACGAGDRFAATAAGLLADGELTERAVRGAVHAATRYVAEGGVRSLSSPAEGARPVPTAEDDALGMAARVRAAGGTVVAAGGCFDLLHAGHVSLLEAARRAGDCLVVCVNSDASVSRRKGPGRPLVRLADRIRVLRALECVDAVAVFDEDTPERLLAELRPHIWAKGGDYALARLPEASLVESWGGQVVLFPYLDGRSTTNLARRAASGPRLVGRERR